MKMMYAVVAAMVLIAMVSDKADAQISTNPGEDCPPKSGETYYFGHLGGQTAFLTAWIGTVAGFDVPRFPYTLSLLLLLLLLSLAVYVCVSRDGGNSVYHVCVCVSSCRST